MHTQRPKFRKRLFLRALSITISQVVSVSLALFFIIKFPLIAIALLLLFLLSLHTMHMYRAMVMMENIKDN